MVHNQIGGAARLAAPSSYRSTSAFEAIRANLAIPLGMALKTRSKLGCQASNLLCSAMLNNAIIEGTWIFGGWRLCPWIFFAPTVACRFIFFGRQKNSIPWRRAPYKIPDERNSRGYGCFFCLDFSPSRRYAEMAFGTDGRKKPPCRAGPFKKKSKKWS